MTVKSRPLAIGLASLMALSAALLGVARLGCWLVIEDVLRPAVAIVVLNGEAPERALHAASLYRQRWASEIWLTQVPDNEPLAGRIRNGEVIDGGTRLNVRALGEAGVPPDVVRVLREPIRSTAEELRAVQAAARSISEGPLIVVTSKPHTRRTRVLGARAGGTRPVIVRYAESRRWNLAQWWRNQEQRAAVIHELLGLIVAHVTPGPRS